MSSAGNKTIHTKGFVGESITYNLPKTIDISIFAKSRILKLKNEGNIPLKFEASVSNDFISLSATSGNIDVFKELNIDIEINRDILETGSYNSQIFFNINNILDTVDIKIENMKEQKIILEGDIIDADFLRNKNKLIYISTNPLALIIYDVTDKSSSKVSLPFVPTCLSVSPDEKYVVIGYDARASLIDLSNGSIIKTLDVPIRAYDIVLTNDKWAYVTPANSQWEYLYCVNFTEGSVNKHSGNLIYGNTRIGLHPSGNYIYSLQSDLEKFNIKNGVAKYMYDSSYHYDYNMGNNLWFSEDGIRIFTGGSSVFKTSELQTQDMLYNGTIPLPKESYYSNLIQCLTHSASKENLYIILIEDYYKGTLIPNLFVYNANNLTFRNKLDLENYIVKDDFGNGQIYQPSPYFVFCNTSGQNVYVITKAEGAGLLREWALQELYIE